MSCVIREVDETSFDPDLLERQLGLALIKQAEGDPQKLLVTVLDFLKRKSNFFKHGDPKKRLLDAFDSVYDAGSCSGAAASAPAASPGAAAAAPPPAAVATRPSDAGVSTATAAAPSTAPTEKQEAPTTKPAAAEAAAAAPGNTSGPPSPDVVPKAAAGEAGEEGAKPDQGKNLSELLANLTVCLAQLLKDLIGNMLLCAKREPPQSLTATPQQNSMPHRAQLWSWCRP